MRALSRRMRQRAQRGEVRRWRYGLHERMQRFRERIVEGAENSLVRLGVPVELIRGAK